MATLEPPPYPWVEGGERPDPPDVLYHYTSPAGLVGIVESESLHCTSIHHLSDAEEISYAIGETRALLEKLEQELQGQQEFERENALLQRMTEALEEIEDEWVFVGSFSAHGNQLSQWRAYCPDRGGYSIGFDGKRLEALATIQGFDLVQCVYSTADYWPDLKELVWTTLDAFGTGLREGQPEDEVGSDCVDHFHAHLARLASRVKHPKFEEEDEWRLVSAPYVHDPVPLGFREGPSFLMPYKEFQLWLHGDQEMGDLDYAPDDLRLPITEIFVGPTPHPEAAQLSAHMLCNQTGVWPDIELSGIPYRTW